MVTDENVVSETKNDKTGESSQEEAQKESNNESKPQPTSKASKKEEANNNDNSSKNDKATEELEEKLKKAEEKASQNWDEVLRARADLDNTRKRLERDVENAHKYAVEKFMQELLPVIDSLEMGLAAANQQDADINKVKEGTELTLKMFADCVNKFGIQSIDPKGEKFNPEFHQAMSIQETPDHKPDTVMAVMQKGYLLNGRLVRPAMVVVSKAASESEEKGDKKTEDGEKPDKNS